VIASSVCSAVGADELGGGIRYVRRSSFSDAACEESNDVSDWWMARDAVYLESYFSTA
jgi:hypothetical protein